MRLIDSANNLRLKFIMPGEISASGPFIMVPEMFLCGQYIGL